MDEAEDRGNTGLTTLELTQEGAIREGYIEFPDGSLDTNKVIHMTVQDGTSFIDLHTMTDVCAACQGWQPRSWVWHNLDMRRVTKFAVSKLSEVAADRVAMNNLPHATVKPAEVVPLKLLQLCGREKWKNLTAHQQETLDLRLGALLTCCWVSYP